jgi:hypothetical protein
MDTPEPLDSVIEFSPTGQADELTQLKQVSERLGWLQDLQLTISREGVSSTDMQVLGEIRDALTTLGVEFEPKPSLECYTPACFTAERSSVNLSVAQEGIADAIYQTIRKLLKRLHDFMKTTLQWLGELVRSETLMRFKIEKLYKATLKVSEGANQLTHKFVADTSGVNKNLDKLRHDILRGSGLKPTLYQLAAFGEPNSKRRVDALILNIRQVVAGLNRLTNNTVQALARKGALDVSALRDLRVFDNLSQIVTEMGLLSAVDPTKDYFLRKPLPYLPAETGQHVQLDSKAQDLAPYGPVLEFYKEQTKKVDKLWMANLGGSEISDEAKFVVEVLRKLSGALEELEEVIRFLYTFNRAKLNVLALCYRYENHRFTWLYKEASKAALTEAQEKAIEKIRDDYRQIVASILS